MDQLLPYFSAFIVGLLGGVHCIGMCGGIVGALTFGLPEQKRQSFSALLPFQLSYNLGRLISYVIAGAIMGGLGMLLAELMPIQIAQRGLLVIAGIFMVLLGLYLSGWWMVLNRVERMGGALWRKIEPFGRRLMPVQTPLQALGIGMIWGWVPCGLVYTMLINAVSSGGAIKGAGLMFAFALGTLPNLLAMGLLAGAAARLARSDVARKIAGVTVILFGIYTLWSALR
ncbi:MAG: sulfite exporter TauE/SafE family protein [Sedimenticola sp.]|uniref:Sulfite exporter TauE/SafE family protein n=1 Tax=Sedimenticola thiotaurini TaxID=1543721 RepID=A0A558CXE0_9GAMM|nr:sulfite exporter TauE/SafE family protein [Sedimenticola sp.]TVT53424.1 MAG: sulfite exporter TauE/SafE family protein [Sedimenticola thiotaurini]MCW8921333.1 sulfite exporter TauE/SafE family protein [Sedimenticola sp.]MCW8946450.1 sulfite exporter TauE/SafE family protein [Sedimenticola sp.]MCW8977087.1 sulfite exporter TauE/SafE family protein [Sedimenticola sp.]